MDVKSGNVRKEHRRFSRHVTRTKRWKALRAEILERDRYRCQSCGCAGRLEVDHIEPVRTHPELSYDPANLQALCPACHTRKTRIECGHKPKRPERREWDMAVSAMEAKPTRRNFSIPTGLEPSRIPVKLVFGPPAAGKTTFATENYRPGDIVIDLDGYLAEIGGAPWETDPALIRAAFEAHDADLRSLAHRRRGTAWLLKGAPSLAERTAWRLALRRIRYVPILTEPQICIERIRADPARQHQAEKMIATVHEWWRTYRAENGETQISKGT